MGSDIKNASKRAHPNRLIILLIVLAPIASVPTRSEGAVTAIARTVSPANFAGVVDDFLGAAFITGPSDSTLISFTLPVLYESVPDAPLQPKLEIETRGTDGSVGPTIYTIAGTANWSWSGDVLTFNAPTSFTLVANTGYWAVISDYDGVDNPGDYWGMNIGLSTYSSQLGFSIPQTDSEFASRQDNEAGDGYLDQATYAMVYSLAVTPVPEPDGLLVIVGLTYLVFLFGCRRIRRIAMPQTLITPPTD